MSKLHAIYTFLLTFFFLNVIRLDNGRKEQKKKSDKQKARKGIIFSHLLNISVFVQIKSEQRVCMTE